MATFPGGITGGESLLLTAFSVVILVPSHITSLHFDIFFHWFFPTGLILFWHHCTLSPAARLTTDVLLIYRPPVHLASKDFAMVYPLTLVWLCHGNLIKPPITSQSFAVPTSTLLCPHLSSPVSVLTAASMTPAALHHGSACQPLGNHSRRTSWYRAGSWSLQSAIRWLTRSCRHVQW